MLYEKQFQKDHDKLQKIRLQVIAQQELYDEARLSAKCASCAIGKEDLKKDFYSRCQQCKKGIKCGKVRKCYEVLSVLRHQEDGIREEYAHNIYSFLSELKPNLLNREDKKVYSWNEVFGQSYEELNENLKNALVAVVEQVGGRYRIAE